ncbi:MAG TPA: HAD family acid phosphatase, partial [Geobacterales bacterium]|nr:HAD family acid phosphatase [Geobacterales bacterium]
KRAFEIIKDPKYYDILKERTITLHEHIANKRPPLKEAALRGEYNTCLRCPYNAECRPLELDIESDAELVVCELDNVIFDVEQRKNACLNELQLPINTDPRNLDKDKKEEFFKLFYSEKYLKMDKPIHEIIKDIDTEYLKNGRKIVIVTNRPETIRKETEEELTELGIPYEALFMRKSNQKGKKFKAAVIKLLEISGYRVVRIIDEEQTVEKIKKEMLKLDET